MVLTQARFRRAALIATLAAASLMTSCKDKPAAMATAPTSTAPAATAEAPDASAETAAASDAGASDGGKHAKRRGHGGPGAMLFRAARGLELKPEQKAKLDTIEKTAHESASDATRDAMKNAAKAMHADLVAGIKAGAVDAKKLEPHFAAIEKLVTAARDKEAEALNALHATLDPKQRKAAVASVRAQHAAREEKKKARGDAGADGGRGGKGGGAKHSLTRLTRGLELDAAQQKKVDALTAKSGAAGARPDPAEMKKRMEGLLAAFEKDTFDAKKILGAAGKEARGPMAQEMKLLGQLLPILKPAQREKLAAEMDKGPSPHGRRGGFEHRMADGDDDDDE